MEIYRGDFEIRVPYARSSTITEPDARSSAETELELALELQGCADIGYCYVPMRWNRRVRLPEDR